MLRIVGVVAPLLLVAAGCDAASAPTESAPVPTTFQVPPAAPLFAPDAGRPVDAGADAVDAAEASVRDAASPRAALVPKTVRLLRPGREPRVRLRLHLAVDDVQTSTMTITASVSGPGAYERVTLTEPLTIRIVDVLPSGDARFHVAWGALRVQGTPGLAAEANKAKAELEKHPMDGTAWVDDRGVVRDWTPDPGAVADADQVTTLLESFAPPFPEDPVGPGAEWETGVDADGKLLAGTTRTVYRLLSQTGDKCTLTVVVNAGASLIDAKLASMQLHGNGNVVVNLGKLASTSSDVTVTTRMHGGDAILTMSNRVVVTSR